MFKELLNSPSFWKKPPSNFTTRQSRLAVTVPAPVGDPHVGEYPFESDNPNTYWIVFVDAKYAKHAGFTTVQINNRQFYNLPRVLARNTIEDVYIEPRTLLEVTCYDGRWWFTRGEGDVQSSSSESEESESGVFESSGSESGGSESGGGDSGGDSGGSGSGGDSGGDSGGSGSGGDSGGDSGGSGSGSESGIGDSEGSESGSGGSESGIGDSAGSESGVGDSHGSSKDTAVVPASWSPGKYTALAALECPDVRFDEVMMVNVVKKQSAFVIDPKYVEVCERGTIKVCGYSSPESLPYTPGISVDGADLRIQLGKGGPRKVTLTIRLTAIRRGFLNWRFPDRTRVEFKSNECRIKGKVEPQKK